LGALDSHIKRQELAPSPCLVLCRSLLVAPQLVPEGLFAVLKALVVDLPQLRVRGRLVARVEELPQVMRDPGLMGVLGVVIPILAPLDIGLPKLVGHACHSFLREASLTMRC